MKSKIINLLLIITFLLTGCSLPSETEESPHSTISVSGTGFANTVPDTVDIQLGVDSIDFDPAAAVNQNTELMNKIMEVLGSMDISNTDVQTVYYSMWVEDVYDEIGQLTGERRYRVTNQVNIRVDDLAQTGILLQKAIKAGATTVAGITFGVADSTELELAALDNAIIDARQKAEQIASEMGVELGPVISISEGAASYPTVPYYGEKGLGGGGGGGVPVSEGQFSVTMSVQIVFELIP